jgi:hypothetical protein
VLALSCAYQCRFEDRNLRDEYALKMCKILNIAVKKYRSIIDFEHYDLIKRLNPPPTVARNFSLRENLFLMFVCVANKIPLFLTGNPG